MFVPHAMIALVLTVLAPHASALPLLAQNAAQQVSTPLTLYPDHENPNLFYYMPNSSAFTLTSTGLPHFGLTYWGIDPAAADAGGLMVFQMRLASTPDQRAALDEFLRGHPGAGIAVLPVMQSTLTLQSREGHLPLESLFTELNFPPHAGRAEDAVAVNGLLTTVGARAMRGAIRNPAIIKFDYCYKVQGLGPDFDATITADFQRIYDHFRAAASGAGWFTRVQVAHESERLRQSGAISIVINGGNATDEEYIHQVAEQISNRVLSPVLSTTPAALPGVDGWSFSRLELGHTHREEFHTETWSLTRRLQVEREFCVPMMLDSLRPYIDQVVSNADRIP